MADLVVPPELRTAPIKVSAADRYSLPAIRAVGYRQLWQHLAGECSLEQALDRAVAATRQLAKRQLTWLRKWPDLEWIYTDSEGNVLENDGSEPEVGEKPLARALKLLDLPPPH